MWCRIGPARLCVQISDGQRGDGARYGGIMLDQQQACPRVVELSNGLWLGQGRVDRRHGSTEPPAREQHHHKLNAVAQPDGDNVPGTNPEIPQVTRRGSDTAQKSTVAQRLSIVTHRRPVRVHTSAQIRQHSKTHWRPAYSGAGIANMVSIAHTE
jgi:hypothetical protein